MTDQCRGVAAAILQIERALIYQAACHHVCFDDQLAKVKDRGYSRVKRLGWWRELREARDRLCEEMPDDHCWRHQRISLAIRTEILRLARLHEAVLTLESFLEETARGRY